MEDNPLERSAIDTLKETAKDYEVLYPSRLKAFINYKEADEKEFIEHEKRLFLMFDKFTEKAKEDGVQDVNVYSDSPFPPMEEVRLLGSSKVYYSIKRKLEFLEKKEAQLKSQEHNLKIDPSLKAVVSPNSVAKIESDRLAPAIALFCKLINETGIIVQGDQTNAEYCKSVCNHYKLTYKDRIRQNFPNKVKKGPKAKLVNEILSKVDGKTKSRLMEYLKSQYPNL